MMMTQQPFGDSADEPSQNLLREDAIVLKRKLQFWRRGATLLGGLVVLVLLVAWQRAEFSRDECSESLAMYADEAVKQRLDRVPLELVGTVWLQFDIPQARRYPKHFLVFAANWARTPGDQSIPLAVCEHSHTTLLNRGRNALFSTKNGLVVQWLSETEAEPLVREVQKSLP